MKPGELTKAVIEAACGVAKDAGVRAVFLNADLVAHERGLTVREERTPSSDPWASLVEPERAPDGRIVQVATIFLTNRECPLRCLMCDLWKNTLQERTPPGAIPAQIDYALARLPPAPHVKLYNSGSFFDPRAIPVEDYPAIARQLRPFARPQPVPATSSRCRAVRS